MTTEAEPFMPRCRFAMAICDDQATVARLVSDLAHAGVPTRQLCLVEPGKDVMPLAAMPDAIAQRCCPTMSEIRCMIGAWLAADGEHRRVCADCRAPAPIDHIIDRRDDLRASLARGASLLVVVALDDDQQRRSTRILLDHSSHHVETHDLIFPIAEAAVYRRGAQRAVETAVQAHG